jgi:hypothetical protein
MAGNRTAKKAEKNLAFKASLSHRLREIRQEVFGEHGGPELARRLNLPVRTWYNYETGVTVPGEVLLEFIVQTGVNPSWLLNGQGSRFQETLQRIRLGRTSYPLREPITGQYCHEPPGVVFRVDSFLPAVVGEGKDRPSALRDFQCKVHVRLHRLLATFEGAWTGEERRDWEILESHLDLDAYLRNRPIKLYQRGEVIKTEGDRWDVRWLDGRTETLDLEQMPDDFAAFEPGEHFEAFVAIHPGTKALIEMYAVHPKEPPDESVSPEEVWQHAIETAERVRLPHSTLDWTK